MKIEKEKMMDLIICESWEYLFNVTRLCENILLPGFKNENKNAGPITENFSNLIMTFTSNTGEEAFVKTDGDLDLIDEQMTKFISKIFQSLYQSEISIFGRSIVTIVTIVDFDRIAEEKDSIDILLSFKIKDQFKKTSVRIVCVPKRLEAEIANGIVSQK